MALRNLGCIAKFSEVIPRQSLSLTLKRSTSLYNWVPQEKETHTGQKWSEDDYRLARFIETPKQVNPNWAVKLIAEVPPIGVKARVTCCDGGGGPKGHPKVYINLDKPGCHSCLYCGLRFYKDECTH